MCVCVFVFSLYKIHLPNLSVYFYVSIEYFFPKILSTTKPCSFRSSFRNSYLPIICLQLPPHSWKHQKRACGDYSQSSLVQFKVVWISHNTIALVLVLAYMLSCISRYVHFCKLWHNLQLKSFQAWKHPSSRITLIGSYYPTLILFIPVNLSITPSPWSINCFRSPNLLAANLLSQLFTPPHKLLIPNILSSKVPNEWIGVKREVLWSRWLI